MCALAAMLEDRGLATVVIGLVRPHMERSANPRGLFVPFPLGRPLGDAGNPAFQHRVLAAALALLDRPDGPVLEDFPEDAPAHGWSPAFAPRLSAPATPAEWQAALDSEIAQALPHWQQARSRTGRTAIGASFLPPQAWPAHAAAFLSGDLPAAPPPLASPALGLRFLADDLRAFITEAALGNGQVPPPDQLNAWFYAQTMSGRLLVALRKAAQDSPDNGFKTMGTRFLVPTPWVPTG